MKWTHCFVEVSDLIQMVFLLVNYFFSTSKWQVSLCPWTAKESPVWSRIMPICMDLGSWTKYVFTYHDQHTPALPFSPCIPRQGVPDTHRGGLANRNLCLAWRTKDFHMMFFPCNAWIQSLWTFFLHRKSIAHNLNWPEASAITYLGRMPRFISWYCPVTDVLIARSFWVCSPPLLFLSVL